VAYTARNDDFGRDRSRCFIRKDLALESYNKLSDEFTMERILSQGVPKVIKGVGDNVEVIPEYQLA
jgi:hypothetical protein